jgi:naphthalene 1,2-dioxygenase ferredoxin component
MKPESRWIPLCKVDDPIAPHGNALEVEGRAVALFMVDGCRYATSNICTHQLALMTDGYVEGEFVDCPMHQGRFHIPTGAPQGRPVTKPLRTYALRIEGDTVLIDMPEPLPSGTPEQEPVHYLDHKD